MGNIEEYLDILDALYALRKIAKLPEGLLHYVGEIFCDQYMDEGVIRKPIKLHRGLNIVVGGADASNSIGKTTFLLAIDFALGGKTYAR